MWKTAEKTSGKIAFHAEYRRAPTDEYNFVRSPICSSAMIKHRQCIIPKAEVEKIQWNVELEVYQHISRCVNGDICVLCITGGTACGSENSKKNAYKTKRKTSQTRNQTFYASK